MNINSRKITDIVSAAGVGLIIIGIGSLFHSVKSSEKDDDSVAKPETTSKYSRLYRQSQAVPMVQVHSMDYYDEANTVIAAMSCIYQLDNKAWNEDDETRKALIRSQEATLIRQTIESAVRCTLDYYRTKPYRQENLSTLIVQCEPYLGTELTTELGNICRLCNHAIHRDNLYNEFGRFIHATKIPGKLLQIVRHYADSASEANTQQGDE